MLADKVAASSASPFARKSYMRHKTKLILAVATFIASQHSLSTILHPMPFFVFIFRARHTSVVDAAHSNRVNRFVVFGFLAFVGSGIYADMIFRQEAEEPASRGLFLDHLRKSDELRLQKLLLQR